MVSRLTDSNLKGKIAMEQNNHKKITFSGIQPTGTFTLGNYLGAVRNWKLMQEEYNCCYSIVNQHAKRPSLPMRCCSPAGLTRKSRSHLSRAMSKPTPN